MDFCSYLIEEGAKLGFSISPDEAFAFQTYKDFLIEENEKYNLTAIKEEKEIIIKHFLDSLTICNFIEGGKIIDIGTGAGFPAVPLKIMKPALEVLLLDSTKKKINFLSELIKKLSLTNIEPKQGRAEEIAKDERYRESFDYAVSRAVSNLQVLTELCLPLVKIGGYFLAMKGPSVEDEIKSAAKAIEILGGRIERVAEVKLSSELTRKVVLIKKMKASPKKYPRSMSRISQRPLE